MPDPHLPACSHLLWAQLPEWLLFPSHFTEDEVRSEAKDGLGRGASPGLQLSSPWPQQGPTADVQLPVPRALGHDSQRGQMAFLVKALGIQGRASVRTGQPPVPQTGKGVLSGPSALPWGFRN